MTRFRPQGEVPVAARLSVTFSEPMVAVATQEASAATQLPVRLAPQPPGEWLWLDTKTLIFQPQGRLPMATEYRVTIPAGVRSATGQALAKKQEWTFHTPAAAINTFEPLQEGSDAMQPKMLLGFNQRQIAG